MLPSATTDSTLIVPRRAEAGSASQGSPASPRPQPPRIPSGPQQSASRRGRLPLRDLLGFTSQLAIMTRSGVDVASALQSLSRQCRRPALKQLVTQIHQDVTGGKSLSDALGRHSGALGHAFVASVAAGEAAGRLPDVLGQIARLQRSEIRLRNTLRSLLTYPILLLAVSSTVLVALILFVLPQFAKIFEQFETPLPALTSLLLVVSGHLHRHLWLWLALAVAVVIAGVVAACSAAGRKFFDRLLLNTRLIRDVTRALLIGRACQLLSIMIGNGVPVLDSLRLTKASMRNSMYHDLFTRLEGEVLNGRGLGQMLLATSFVPSGAAEMMATAERTGNLAAVTQLLGEHCEEEAETRLRELVSILEPTIILCMGFLVAIVVLAVMLPMFDLATLSQQGS